MSYLFLFILAIAFVMGSAILARRIQNYRLQILCKKHRLVVLTYDDGPSAELTPRLVELLTAENAPATFFLLGDFVQQNSEVLPALSDQRFEIGSHTRNHSNAWRVAPWRYWADVAQGWRDLDAAGLSHRFFRPPFGKTTVFVLAQIWFAGRRFAYWSIDTQDSWNRRPIPDILAEIEAKNGGVILMHDRSRPLRGPSPEDHPEYLLALTKAIIDLGKKKGLTFIRFGDLMERVA